MAHKTEQMNLHGVKCPLNWAKAKVRLEYLERGDVLELLIDDAKGRRDIPRAAEAEGYVIVDIDEFSDPADPVDSADPEKSTHWRILIEK
jgi:tRNA 2-thiouridine synthesizing protein A